MCYMTLLSTTSNEDLSQQNDNLVRFSRDLPGLAEESHLAHPHRWFIGSRDGCSCGFRHLYVDSVDLGFAEPQEWYPEEPEDIEATRRLAATIRRLVDGGAQVDCVDAWDHGSDANGLSGTIHVDLAAVPDQALRFFENHRFVFER